jgi:hypothetical protein
MGAGTYLARGTMGARLFDCFAEKFGFALESEARYCFFFFRNLGKMPDKNGKLSPDEKEKALKWVAGKPCPFCGRSDWFVGDDVIQTPRLGTDPLGAGKPTYGAVLLFSQTCGYTIMFNSTMLGITSNFKPPSS